jgi:hypothetical protein
MKHPLLLFCLLASLAGNTLAQDSTAPRPLHARVWTIHHQISEGYLYDIRDSSLLLSWEKHLPRFHDTTRSGGLRSFAYRDIDVVSTYRRKTLWSSMGIGFAVGAAAGAIAGFASGDDPNDQWFALTAGEKAIGVGALGGIAGTITGLIIGVAGHKTFYIHGKKEKFDRMSKKLAGIALP